MRRINVSVYILRPSRTKSIAKRYDTQYTLWYFSKHSITKDPITKDAITSHFEIAKRKSNEDLNNFKLKFEEPLLFTIDITNKKIEFKF